MSKAVFDADLNLSEGELEDAIFEKKKQLLDRVLEHFGLGSGNLEVYNQFIKETLAKVISGVVINATEDSKIIFTNVLATKPQYVKDNQILPLFPQQARRLALTYGSDIYVDVEHIDANGRLKNKKDAICIGKIPVMKGSVLCHLHGIRSKTELEKLGEDPLDPDGYFIVGGVEKVVLVQEQLAINRIFIMNLDAKTGPVARLTVSSGISTHVIEVVTDKKSHMILKLRLPSLKRFKEKEDKKKKKAPLPESIELADASLVFKKKTPKKNGTLNVLSIFQLLGVEDLNEIRGLISAFLPEKHREQALLKLVRTEVDYSVSSNSYNETVTVLGRKITPNPENMSPLDFKERIDDILYRELFPHLNDAHGVDGESPEEMIQRVNLSKVNLLAIMVAQMLEYQAGFRPLSDRNSWSNKKTEEGGRLIQQLFNGALRKMIGGVKYNKKAPREINNLDSIMDKLKQNIITDSFYSSFTTPKWGVKGSQTRDNISQTLSRDSLVGAYAHLNTIDVNISRTGNSGEVQNIQPTSYGFICSVATPEGENCGLLKNFGITTTVSLIRSDTDVIRFLMGDNNHDKYVSLDWEEGRDTRLMVGAKFIGWCNGIEVRDALLEARRSTNGKDRLPPDTTIVLDDNPSDPNGWLYVDISPSRPIRPLLIVEGDSNRQYLELFEKKVKRSFEDEITKNITTKEVSVDTLSPVEWLREGAMEYLSPWEQEQKRIKIATRYEDIVKRNIQIAAATSDLQLAEDLHQEAISNGNVRDGDLVLTEKEAEMRLEGARDALSAIGNPYTHCEIDPKAQFSIQANLIHYIEHNQAPRNTYQASMIKQALGIYHRNYRNRFDGTTKQLPMAHPPLITTQMYNTLGLSERNTGCNVNLLFATLPYTEEDSFVFNRQYLDAGGHRIVKHIVFKTTIKTATERLARPKLMENENKDKYKYIHGGGSAVGLPLKGAYLKAGDCVIGKVAKVENKDINVSVFLKLGDEGIVDKVSVFSSNSEETVIVKLRITRVPIVGDKFAPRNAQKGTIAIIESDINLPTTIRGICPSIITNTSSLSSRMTISYPMEMVFSRYAALKGKIIDGSGFVEGNQVETYREVNRVFVERGRNPYGYETMYSGLSGIKYAQDMNMSLVYFQALKHHSKDKIQARGLGRVRPINRQPHKGKSMGGGLRFGEMERDAVIAHGGSSLVLERLMYASDQYRTVICTVCGTIVSVNAVDNGCKFCGNTQREKFVVKDIPYAVKLLIHMLSTMGIRESLRTLTGEEYVRSILEQKRLEDLEEATKDNEEDEEYGDENEEENEEMADQDFQDDLDLGAD